ncbi:MAG: SulP family inorganic anion transporter [Dongiaceae bacterium]
MSEETSEGTKRRGRGWAPPLVAQLRGYRPAWLRDDVVAGLSVAAVALPTAIAYPAIVGLPPVTGIYAATIPTVAYALLGPSRRLMVGPDSATCLVLASTMVYLGAGGAEDRVVLAAALAVLTGLLCLLARALRLGFIADFLSRPVLTGFLAGIAVDLIIGQLGRLSGVAVSSKGLLRPILEFLGKLDSVHPATLAVGLGLFVLLRILRRWVPRAPGPLIAILLALVLGATLDLAGLGVRMVGAIPGALPRLALPVPYDVAPEDLVLAALSILLVSFGSGIITARSFGARYGAEVDADRELVGFGAANLAAGLFGGFPVTSSDSRTAVNFIVGGRTQIAGLVAAGALLAAALLAGGAFASLPVAALGAVLASAAIDLIDVPRLAALWRIDRIEFSIAMATLLGVVIFGVLRGVALAVIASLVHLLWLTSRPRDARLGLIPGRHGIFKLHHYPEAAPIPGLALYLPQGPLVFFNADYIKSRLLDLAEEQGLGDGSWLILDAGAVSHLDSSAVESLRDVVTTLQQRGIGFGIAELHGRPRAILERSGLAAMIGPAMLFHSIEDAVAAFRAGRPLTPPVAGG